MNDSQIPPNRDCARFRPLLALAAHADLLDVGHAAEFSAHLAGCPACRAELAALERAEDALRRYAAAVMRGAPATTKEEIMRQVQENVRTQVQPDGTHRRTDFDPTKGRMRRTLRGLPAVAAVLVVIALAVALFARLHPSAGVILRGFAAPTSAPALQTIQPINVPGTLYYAVKNGSSERIFAMRASDRFTLWEQSIKGMLVTSPALLDNTLYFMTSENQTLAPPIITLTAIRPPDGTILWQYRGNIVTGVPVAAEAGFVYVPLEDGMIALRADNASTLWRYQGAEMLGPAVANGVVFTLTTDHVLVALDASSGKRRWSQGLDETMTLLSSVPHVAGGYVFATTSKSVYAFDAQTGAQVWRQTAQSVEDAPDYLASNAVANGIVCVPNHNGLKAYRANDGQQIWTLPLPQRNISLPEIVGDSVVYITGDDHLHGARLSDGMALWETPVFGTGRAEGTLGGLLYAVSGDATLTVLDAATGKVVGSYDLGTSIIDGLVVGA